MPTAALLTVLAYSVLPFAGFLNENKQQGIGMGTLIPYVLVVALPAIFVVLAVKLRKGREAAERAAVVVAACLFVFFNFHNLGKVLNRADLTDHELEIWASVFLAAIAVAYVLAKRPWIRLYVLVGGLLLVAIPIGQYASFRFTGSDGIEAVSHAQIPPGDRPGSAAERPNVYFFVLDGYGRNDQLLKHLDFDNGAFTRGLSRRGFHVGEQSYASYSATHLSIASTLEMDYLVTEGQEVSPDRDAFYRMLRGENETVRGFRALGYRYVVAPPGYWPGTRCSEIEDVCVEPLDGPGLLGGFGETEWAVMALTPLANAAQRWVPGAGVGPYNEPGHLLDALEKEGLREPYFVFSHMMNPHPPYRYHADCSLRDSESDPEAFGEGRYLEHRYVDMLQCANKLMRRAVDRIIRRDPGAIIILQGDHGTAFTAGPDRAVSDWSREHVQERFSPLNAIRLPKRCRGSLNDSLALINTFPTVFACVRGKGPKLLPFKAYVTNENAGDVRSVLDKVQVSGLTP